MATQVERLAIVETQVENISEKVDAIKVDVKDLHDCLDNTREAVMSQLTSMHTDSCQQHNVLAAKISELEKAKVKITVYALIAMAFAAGAGWFDKIDLQQLVKFFF